MLCHCDECHYVVCRILFNVILSVIMLNVVRMSVVAPQGQLYDTHSQMKTLSATISDLNEEFYSTMRQNGMKQN